MRPISPCWDAEAVPACTHTLGGLSCRAKSCILARESQRAAV